jgi:hypothetical protein
MTEPSTTTRRYCKKPADDKDGLCSQSRQACAEASEAAIGRYE